MDYEFRSRSGSGPGSYGGAGGGGGGSSLYPRVGQPAHGAAGPPPQRPAPYLHATASPSPPAAPAPAPSSSSTSMGIQVVIKPEYRITPPPQLAPQMVEVPRSTFNFDFEYERKILAEAEKENPNWGKFVIERQTPPPPQQQQQQQQQPPRGPRHSTSTTSMATPGDPLVEKYMSMGLGREAVSFAVLNYGDNPTKVKEFVKAYNALHEMGFTSRNVPELLAMHDNDPDKVIQHLLSIT
ncbi:proline-rich receptor-like protein kinase PERK10 [Hordeum vulgare subsp. vulgare]|uniref:Predicted protein n=1 Tax=Hordeum vulgare subsp. vulgare TaxID=112509 RepID=F2DNG1_HORVV|nr:proline-rich receptor-like protein kinase PERK10 [Hordeum vulgare subsp. vulgare]KAI4976975.1 hypothetical protein ZWY2020_050582 [Hordeum vulgare]BAJ96632.1 predicted protein [Hordeum vulgare subsp. vulgare]